MSRSKRLGTEFETACVNLLIESGYPHAERRALAGTADKGDVTGLGPDWVIECKNQKEITLAGFVDEAEVERVNAGAKYGVAVIKRRGKNARHAYAIMPFEKFIELMKERDQ